MPDKKQKYYNESGKEITKEEWNKKDKDLEKSISGYPGYKSMYDQQKEEKAKNLSAEATRQQRIKQNPVADNTYVKKPIGYFKKGGVVSKAKKFAALAPPYDKATAADKIAGAKGTKSKKTKSSKPKMKLGGSCGTPKRLGKRK